MKECKTVIASNEKHFGEIQIKICLF